MRLSRPISSRTPRRRPALVLVSSVIAGGAVVAAGVPLASAAAPVALNSASAAATTTATCPPAGGTGVAEAKPPSGAQVVLSGHGWGHGMGMSQYGAQGAARLGCDYTRILTTYYRGTRVVTRSMSAPVRLSMDSAATRGTVLAEVRAVGWRTSAGAKALQPKGSTWSVVRATRSGTRGFAVKDSTGVQRLWAPAGKVIAVAHAGTSVRLRSYHASTSPFTDRRLRQGSLWFTRTGSSLAATEVINGDATNTAVQKYLWGLGEVPVSWPAHALRAQVVAARTYLAGRYDAGLKAYRIGITTSDQVYRGAAAEDADVLYRGGWKAAVTATKDKIVVDGAGARITTMYSSSMGGYTENRAYVYGSQGGFGYLTAVDDSRWDAASDNPYRSWAKGYSRSQFAAKLGFSSVSRVTVGARGTAVRNRGVVVTGVRNGVTVTKAYTGAQFRSTFGVRSPGFTVRLTIGGVGAQALVGDWDGDGRTDTGWYRNPDVRLRTAKGTLIAYRFDVAGAKAVVADFDGDGKDGVSLFKDGRWYLRDGLSSTATTRTLAWGWPGDVPVAGHWRTGAADSPGLVRGSRWILRTSTTDPTARDFTWSVTAGTPVVGDWNGNGVDGPGRRSGKLWTLGADVPTSGTGAVKAPAVWHSTSFTKADGVVPAGMAKGTSGSTPTIVREATFIWRTSAPGTATSALTFGG